MTARKTARKTAGKKRGEGGSKASLQRRAASNMPCLVIAYSNMNKLTHQLINDEVYTLMN